MIKDVEKLAAIIEMLIRYHPAGLRILLGNRPSLTSLEWADLVNSIRGTSDPDIRVDKSLSLDGCLGRISVGEEIIDVLERVGWDNVVRSAQSFRQIFPKDWNMFVEHLGIIDNPFASRLYHESALQRLAGKYDVDPKTVTRRRKMVPLAIAREAIGGFQLALFAKS